MFYKDGESDSYHFAANFADNPALEVYQQGIAGSNTLFLCEGEETEPIYFAKLKKLREEAGISSLIDFIQIEKPHGSNLTSCPRGNT